MTPEPMLAAVIRLSLLGSIALAVVLAAAAAAAAWLSYRRTVPPLPTGRRILLTSLRALAMIVLALLIGEPVLQFVETHTDAPVIALLLDDSRSLPVSGKGAREQMAAFVSSAPGSAPDGARLRYFPFSGSVTGALDAPPESLSHLGDGTDLSGALNEIRKRAREENIRAVVLATDGNYNEGRNPLNELEGLSIPVFAAGAGDTIRQKDLLVDRVFTNAIAYAGSTVPVEAYVRSFGFGGRRVEVTIEEAGAVAGRVPVTLEEGKTEYPVRFSIPAGTEGVHKYVVSVNHLQGELTRENNSQTFFLRVLKSRIKVALFAGVPSPDVAAMRLAVSEDPQMEVRSYVQKSPGVFIGDQPSQPAIDSADCFVFVGFPSALTSDATTGQLLTAMRKAKKPLLYVHGKRVEHAKLRAFEEFLPIQVSQQNTAEDPVFASVPERMKHHPLVAGGDTAQMSAESWDRLPPVFKMRVNFQARQGSDVLAFAKINTVTLTEPLVAIRNVAGSKSLAITAHGIYRWRLMAQGSPATEHFFATLVSNAIRWLTTRENEKPVRVEPLKDIFTTAEGVGFRAEVYDEQLRPVDNAEVAVEYSAAGEKYTLALEPIGNGRYEGIDGAVPAGDYAFRGSAKSGQRSLGADAGKFSVGPVNVEFLSTPMNRQLLEQIGSQSGGAFHPITQPESLWRDVAARTDLVPREEVTRTEIELWNYGWLGAALVLLLAIEWFLRKRWALL